jgi:hypothetical protein
MVTPLPPQRPHARAGCSTGTLPCPSHVGQCSPALLMLMPVVLQRAQSCGA